MKADLENLYYYFYKEKGDMQRCTMFCEIAEKIPEVRKIWDLYKEAIEEAEVLLEFRFEKLIEKVGMQP